MKIPSEGGFFSYVLILTLVGSIFSTVVPFQSSYSSHTDLEVQIDDIEFDQGDEVVISGNNQDGNEDDNVDITIHKPGTGSDPEDDQLDQDLEFSVVYTVPSEDGLYEVEVEFEGVTDHVWGFFFVDDEDNVVEVTTDRDVYAPGDDVVIEGEVTETETGVTEVEITVIGPDGEEALSSVDVDLESNDSFEYDDLTLDDELHGTYGILVEYDSNEAGFFVFTVEEDGGSGTTTITASLDDTSVQPGDTVTVTGEIDPDDVVSTEEVSLDVEDPNGDPFFSDSVDPDETDGSFEFDIELNDNADEGPYSVTLQYEGYDDKTLTFTVSEGGTDGGTNPISGSDGGLTARINKATFAAGEMMTITGVVPRVVTDEDINIVVLTPNGGFTGSSVFPTPDSDKSYSTSLRLKSTLEEDDDYRVVISYDDNEVTLEFDVTGESDGTGGPITVETDKDSYSTGSTVKVSGEIADDVFVEGRNILIRVYNSEDDVYRFDQVRPSSDGSYSYSMVVGGPRGVSGEWEVIASFEGEEASTTFELTGGAEPKPGYSLRVQDQTYQIGYEISDGEINSMFVKSSEKKLVIAITADQAGTLTVELPREVIDAVEAGKDINYVVTLFDIETGSQKTVNLLGSVSADARTLTIEYEAGTDLIEILGTTVVPEFGPISAIVLAVAIVGIIAMTTRFGKFGPSRKL